MVTPHTKTKGAPTAGAPVECPVCIARAERDASHAAQIAADSARRRRAWEERDAYTPDGAALEYDGPRDEDGEPWPSCLRRWREARDAFTLTPERARARLQLQINAHRARIQRLTRELESLE